MCTIYIVYFYFYIVYLCNFFILSQMSDGLTRDFPKYTYVNRPVSKYVFEMLDLQVGQQTRLIAAKRMCGWVYEDKVMCTARAWKQRRAFGFCQKFQILL